MEENMKLSLSDSRKKYLGLSLSDFQISLNKRSYICLSGDVSPELRIWAGRNCFPHETTEFLSPANFFSFSLFFIFAKHDWFNVSIYIC